jgi:hypothetical protein
VSSTQVAHLRILTAPVIGPLSSSSYLMANAIFRTKPHTTSATPLSALGWCTFILQIEVITYQKPHRKGLSFYTVSFGPEVSSQSLRRMAQIATEVYQRAPRDPLAPVGQDSCSFSRAIDTVRNSLSFSFSLLIGSLIDSTRKHLPPHR